MMRFTNYITTYNTSQKQLLSYRYVICVIMQLELVHLLQYMCVVHTLRHGTILFILLCIYRDNILHPNQDTIIKIHEFICTTLVTIYVLLFTTLIYHKVAQPT